MNPRSWVTGKGGTWAGAIEVVPGIGERYPIVNGTVLVEHDELTDERPGRVLAAL